MTRTRVFFSGLFTTLSLTALPAFADSYTATKVDAQVDARVELKLGAQPTFQTLNRQESERFEDRLGKYEEKTDKTRYAQRYDQKLEEKVLDLVNEVRVQQGLPKLRLDSRGTTAAREASVEASREGNFNHLSSTAEARLRNQGISSGFEVTEATRLIHSNDKELDKVAKKIVQGWMKDKKQARLLLDKNLSYVGVGAVTLDGKSAVTLDAFGAKPVVFPKPPVPQKPAPHCD